MKLRTSLLLTTTVTALLVLGSSEWLSYHETMESLGSHLAEMSRHQGASNDKRSLENSMAALSEKLIWIHFGHALLEVLALVVVLSLFWSKFVLRPIRRILHHMNSMGHSVACQPLSLDREDEIGQMASELNRLRGKLLTALEHAATASELAALALMGQTLVRRISTVRDQLAVAVRTVVNAQDDASALPDSAVVGLEIVLERLSSVADLFEEEFERRLGERRRESRPAKPTGLDAVLPQSGMAPLDHVA